jgi:hypothetical protein
MMVIADTLAKLFDLKNIKIFGITSEEKCVGKDWRY